VLCMVAAVAVARVRVIEAERRPRRR
jgi:hypothetical protein